MKTLFAVVVCLLAGFPLIASDGATPIWAATTITEPGKYILTRDITQGGTTLVIASDNVSLDLNGFTVESTIATFPNSAIYISGTRTNVTIRNGRALSDSMGIRVDTCDGLRVEHVTVTGKWYGIYLNEARNTALRDLSVVAEQRGIYLESGYQVVISDSRFETNEDGLEVGFDGEGLIVHRNAFLTGPDVDTALNLTPVRDAEISENTVKCSGLGHTRGILANAPNSLIRDNLIGDCRRGGIIAGSLSLVLNNVIRNADSESGSGAITVGDANHVEGNLMTGSFYGLWITGSDNVYRRNTARANTVGFVDIGTGNTSHGDNYMPSQM